MSEDSRDDAVGVGPWVGEWPAGDHWDPELLRDGDRRNVVDAYRY
ncbi:rRNA methyltransferase, partial [Salmonella enterica subsp. enterica serovar Senftenberg]|nr:rRNA methyltransferase [Salmonella enterica subsp. enterica serovar Senftenberg]